MISVLENKWAGYALAAVVAVLFLLLVCSHVYNAGSAAAAAKYTAKIAKIKADFAAASADEIERQDKAINIAKANEARQIQEMLAAEQAPKKQTEVSQREAEQDPDAGCVVLRTDSRHCINNIR